MMMLVGGVFAETAYDVEALIIAGGAGGGDGNSGCGGGGGAGGMQEVSSSVDIGTGYTVTIGSGGSKGGTYYRGSDGISSSFNGTTSLKGGAGCSPHPSYTGSVYDAQSGGSGGGERSHRSAAGRGTSGQGHDGANATGLSDGINAGGGGGKGASPANAHCDGGVSSGDWSTWASATSTGVSGHYAGGGGGGVSSTGSFGSNGVGGGGGAGRGGHYNASAATNATANTGSGGGGGGGGGSNHSEDGGNGGSGIIIIRYSGSQRGSGGTVASSGGYTYHTFTSSGTFTA